MAVDVMLPDHRAPGVVWLRDDGAVGHRNPLRRLCGRDNARDRIPNLDRRLCVHPQPCSTGRIHSL